MKIGNLILSILDPFKIIRNYLLKPLALTGIVFAEEYRRKTSAGAKLTKNVVLKLIVLVLLGLSVVWASIFMYAYFYYTYMPTVSHIQDVHLNYRDCSSEKECLQYPTDTVILTKNQQLLMVGQPYRVILHIEMPESEQNDKTGMFTVCGTMHDHLYEFSMKSCRLTMIHYKSGLFKMLSTIFLTPFLVLGYREEKQTISVELFTHFEDSQAHPATSVDIRILSRDIQFYSAQLHITANFSGLRYLMFNWPVLSALIGIISNLFFIVIVCILSWYHWDDTEWIVEIKGRYQQIAGKVKAIEGPKQSEKLLEDDKKIYEIDEISGFKEDIDLTN